MDPGEEVTHDGENVLNIEWLVSGNRYRELGVVDAAGRKLDVRID